MKNEWIESFTQPLDALGGGSLALPAVLEQLLAKTSAAKSAPVRPPVVTLTLSTGRELTGLLLAQSSREPKTFTVAVEAGRDRRLAFVLAASIVGVVVEDVADVGKPLPSVEVAGRLELSRRAKALGEKHAVRCSVDVGDDESSRLTVQLLVPVLDDALAAIRRDDAGKAAMSAIEAVVVRSGEDVVKLDGRTLVVAARAPDRIPSQLEASIAALL